MLKTFFFHIGAFFKVVFLWRRYLELWEKIAVLILLLMVLICGVFCVHNRALAKKVIPARGGTLTEGVVGEVENFHLGRLTFAGLTKFDAQDQVVPDLSEKWEITDDGRTYRFTLRSGIDTGQIVEIINQNIEQFGSVTVDNPEDRIIQFVLTEPLTIFLPATTTPIFPYGPYQIERKDEAEIRLVARKDYYFGEPNISRIVLKFYPDQLKLQQVAEGGEIMAAVDLSGTVVNFNQYQLELPRTISIFLNLRRDIFHDREFRRKFVQGNGLDKPGLNLTLVCSDNLYERALAFKEKVAAQGVNLEIIHDDQMVLLRDYTKPRNFDLLLFGVDLGRSGDYYPYWHSSQMADPGSNFSGTALPGLDKALEDYRTNQNAEERAKDLEEIKKLINEQYAEILLESVKLNYQISNKVQGVVFPTLKDASDRFTEVYSWYIRTKRVR